MKKFNLLAASALTLFVATPAFAQDTTQASQNEVQSDDEIVVTATKREQTLQDVPISVSVTGADTIEKSQITDLIDLQTVVPSLKVGQLNAIGQTNFIIRGFGNGNGNDGIESSVGVFIDGVYRSRSAAALDDLPEIERVEVLRGPQSTLFGKNVSAGAISIVTKRPAFEWGGKAELTYGNYDLFQGRATLTGPISEAVAFRISGNFNQRDGTFTNVTTGTDVTNRNRWGIRADLLIEPSSDFSIRIIGDYNNIDETCCGVTSIFNGPLTQLIGAPTTAGGLGKPIANTSQVFSRNLIFNTDPLNHLRGKGISGQIDWDVGFARFTSITAYRNQVNQSDQDIDFTGADIASNSTANEIGTFTQEFRLTSKGDGPFSWLVGAFYQNEDLDTGRKIRFGADTRSFINAQTGGATGLVFLLESLQRAAGNTAITPGSYYFAQGQGIDDFYKVKQQSYSLFGQADFKVTDRLTITGGLAFLSDRKEAVSNVVVTDKFSMLNLQNIPVFAGLPFAALPASISGCLLQKGYNPASTTPPGTIPVNLFGTTLGASLPGPGSTPCPATPAGYNPFALNSAQFFYGDTANHGPVNFPNASESGIVKGHKLTYAARVAYDLDSVNLYASYSTGWKASAFNLSSDSRPPLNGVGRSANPEYVTVYEVGAKAKFNGGYFNVAVFKQSIEGFQSNAFTGLGYSLVNAGKQSVKGFEIDAAYRPFRDLSLTGSVTYLDPVYDSFTGAACVSFDTVRCPILASTGQMKPFRDLSGERPAGISEWSFSASATYSHQFNGWGFYVRGEYDYGSPVQLTHTTPANLSTWGTSNLNASVGINVGEHFELMAWGRNLTDDQTLNGTFPTVVQTGSYSGYPNQPRTYGLTSRFKF